MRSACLKFRHKTTPPRFSRLFLEGTLPVMLCYGEIPCLTNSILI
jgi:hypothetical protein